MKFSFNILHIGRYANRFQCCCELILFPATNCTQTKKRYTILFQDGILIPGTTVIAEVVTAGDYYNVSFDKLIKICCRGDASLTIASVPNVLTGATLPGTPTVTEIPILQNANVSITKEC
jgi:hypothetical protein